MIMPQTFFEYFIPIISIILLILTLWQLLVKKKQMQKIQQLEYHEMMWQIQETYTIKIQSSYRSYSDYEWIVKKKIVYGSDSYEDCKNMLETKYPNIENESLFENHWTKRYNIVMKEQHKE